MQTSKMKNPWRAALAAAAGLTVAAGALVTAPLALADDAGTWEHPKLTLAEGCEGTTEYDPTEDTTYLAETGGKSVNLLGLWGERYEAYEQGKTVPLYSNDGTGGENASAPLCVVQKGADGPATSWTYCTDQAKAVCGSYDLNGNITDMVPNDDGASYPVGGQVPNEGPNQRLSEEQQKVLAFLLSNEVAIPESAFNWNADFEAGAKVPVASNDSTLQRQARQYMTWCVTDPVDYGGWDEGAGKYWYPFCEQAMPMGLQEDFAKAVANANSAALQLAVSPTEATVGESVQVTVTTSMLRVPLDLFVSDGAAVAVAEESKGSATIAGNTLTVDTSGPVTLNLTSSKEGNYTVTVAGIHPQVSQLAWAQSPGKGHKGKECQIFSHFEDVDPQKLSAEGTVKFVRTLVAPVVPVVEPAECGVGDEGAVVWESVTVPADTDEVSYVVTEVDRVVTVVATPAEGYVLEETAVWVLNEDGTATWTYELQSKECASPVEPDVPEKPDETQSGSAASGDSKPGELPKTGAADIAGLVAVGAVLVAGGAGLALRARRVRR